MNTWTEQRTFYNRDFVALVRAELAAAGRSDVAIERNWIDEDEPGEPFLLHVPLGTELSVPLSARNDFLGARTDDDRQRHAVEFAKALINLRSAEAMLSKYARDVRKAANAAVGAARADGLDILLDRVGFNPTPAFLLTNASWKDAALHVLAEVTFRDTSFHLRPGTSSVDVKEPSDVAEKLKSILEDQRELRNILAEMEAIGADLVVDQITLDLLAAHNIDAEDALRQVWKNQHAEFKVTHLGQETWLSVNSGHGKVMASISLGNAFWNAEYLSLTNEEGASDYGDFVGKSLGDLVTHPVFTSRRVAAVENRHFVFDLSDKSLFDGDTGRIWREKRPAA